ncbi:MAG: AIR synthase-related protein [bacterium]|nr:AIR synthase-related protein [bacterium]
MIQEVRVTTPGARDDIAGKTLLAEIRHLGITSVTLVKTARVYRLEGITAEEAATLALRLLSDPISQVAVVNERILGGAPVVEVAYKPGVMNPEAASIMKAAHDLGITGLVAADSSTEYAFYGPPIADEVQRIVDGLLVNKTVQRVVTATPATLLISGQPGACRTIPLRTLEDTALLELSRDKLFLNLEEMRVIQAYFRQADRDPTDVELETLAQTWSEHCGHKTFRAKLVVNGNPKEPLITRLKTAAAEHGQLVQSSFVDNSGVISFFDGLAVCGKVETHNSPSAIEPYGGAATGSGGVFRDIVGTGQGAKVIASTDIFCFAPPDLPAVQLPAGCLHPHYLLRRVVAGVRDYGNRMGIPTNNGSVHFHPDFRAKPTIIVGAYGIMPERCCRKGKPQTGDLILALGGRTGRDGIHGATFSSGEMTDRTINVNASAVQIGNPIEEKRTFDAILRCRDRGLIRAITDCGAGGFSSAIGEMGADLGVRVALERAPLKYAGLDWWEVWVSEAQERMVVAVAPEHAAEVLTICQGFNLEATMLGEFTGDHRLTVTANGQTICDLAMDFLHHGLPQRIMTARWQAPRRCEPTIPHPSDWAALYRRVLSHRNVCSKEPIVRGYDHGVQGTCALPPYGGVQHDGPNDAVVLQPIADHPYGLVISHGLNPVLNLIDPYAGGLWAATEAIANLVAVGGNPRECALIDNFIWPFPDEESLGQLDRAVDACVDVMRAFKVPFVSGKDSLSSTYRGKDGTVIKIPPVLCVSAFGRIPDVGKTVTADFKMPGASIRLLGTLQPSAMGGSVYYDLHGHLGTVPPTPDLAALPGWLYELHQWVCSGFVLALHDISEGGLAVALAEMCIGGNVGADINLDALGLDARPDFILFNEMAGCFLLEAGPAQYEDGGLDFVSFPMRVIGKTTEEPVITIRHGGHILCSIPMADLKAAWQQPMKEVFH